MKGLDRESSSVIGFVVACLFSEAINLNELRGWADHVMMTMDDHPSYVVDLSQFDGFLKDIYALIGFCPSRGLSDEQDAAISGIAYARGIEPFQCKWSREEALESLRKHPEILDEYRQTFPYLDVKV
jgi:hypothetical protein